MSGFDGSALRLPVMQAPMFIISNLQLALASCRAGIIGAFPAGNPRAPESLETWLDALTEAEAAARAEGLPFAPYCVNLNASRQQDPQARRERLALCRRAKVPLVLTNMGDPRREVEAAHDWGGVVFHDVTTMAHAGRAIEAGVDGLMVVCGGAGGHAGTLNPMTFVPQVRRAFDGLIVLGGGVADGAGIAAALALGADLVVMGTRFIATAESGADPAHKQMLIEAESADVLYTDAISGLAASFLRPSIRAAGLDPDHLPPPLGLHRPNLPPGVKPWKTVWSAGQSVGLVRDIPTVAQLVARLEAELAQAQSRPDWRTRLTPAAAKRIRQPIGASPSPSPGEPR